MIIYIHSKKIRRISITKYIKPKRGFMKPTVLVSFIIFTPFSQMLLNTIHFASSNTALVICIIVTDALIIADKAHLFLKLVDVLRDLWEVLVEISSFCFVMILHSTESYL